MFGRASHGQPRVGSPQPSVPSPAGGAALIQLGLIIASQGRRGAGRRGGGNVLRGGQEARGGGGGRVGPTDWDTANLRTEILDFRGFDSSRILSLRDGILMSVWDFPEMLSQQILVGMIFVGTLGAGSVLRAVFSGTDFAAGIGSAGLWARPANGSAASLRGRGTSRGAICLLHLSHGFVSHSRQPWLQLRVQGTRGAEVLGAMRDRAEHSRAAASERSPWARGACARWRAISVARGPLRRSVSSRGRRRPSLRTLRSGC